MLPKVSDSKQIERQNSCKRSKGEYVSNMCVNYESVLVTLLKHNNIKKKKKFNGQVKEFPEEGWLLKCRLETLVKIGWE